MTALEASGYFAQAQAGRILARFHVETCEICESPLDDPADDKICARHRSEVNQWTTRAMSLAYADMQARKAESQAVRR